MFRILYSEIVEDVLKPLVDVLAGHVTLNEWADILKILKSRRPRPPLLAYCPTVCRPFAWAALLTSQVYTPRRRRFDMLMLYFKARQPGPFNSTTLATHLSILWPGEARDILERLSRFAFLRRSKGKARVTYWLTPPPTPPGSPPGPPPGGGGRSIAGQRFEPGLETQQIL
jgi:hypothetical protein